MSDDVSFSQETFNAGALLGGRHQFTDVSLVNHGKMPVKIIALSSSCGCTSATSARPDVPGLSKTPVLLTITSSGKTSKSDIQVVALFSDNSAATLDVQFQSLPQFSFEYTGKCLRKLENSPTTFDYEAIVRLEDPKLFDWGNLTPTVDTKDLSLMVDPKTVSETNCQNRFHEIRFKGTVTVVAADEVGKVASVEVKLLDGTRLKDMIAYMQEAKARIREPLIVFHDNDVSEKVVTLIGRGGDEIEGIECEGTKLKFRVSKEDEDATSIAIGLGQDGAVLSHGAHKCNVVLGDGKNVPFQMLIL